MPIFRLFSVRPYLFSFNDVQWCFLYTRWRPPKKHIANLGGGHRLGCGSN